MSDSDALFAAVTAAAAAAGVAAIAGELARSWRAVYLFKPLTMTLVITAALLATGAPGGTAAPAAGTYRAGILGGLCFSVAGDVFLMLRRERFVAGLASFLLAHLCYVAALGGTVRGTRPTAVVWAALAALVVYGAVVYRALWPGLAGLRAAVAVYVLVILAMGWCACAAWAAGPGPRTGRALAGAVLFVASDSLLALDRFRKPLPAAPALVLGTYFPAQWLFAWSLMTPAG